MLEYNMFQEKTVQGNIILTIEEQKYFSLTSYRIMQNNNGILVECIKTKKNGVIELVYLTEKYISLRVLMDNIDIRRTAVMMLNIFKKVRLLSEYGFLDMSNVLLDLNKIYVNEKTLEIRFIYLPIVMKKGSSLTGSYVTELKVNFIKYLQVLPQSQENSLIVPQLIRILADGTLDLDELIRKFNYFVAGTTGKDFDETIVSKKSEDLCLLNEKTGQLIHIRHPEMILGRKPPMEDGKISDSKLVGRKHCKITFENEKYYLVDLESVNGTFLNGTRLKPMSPAEISVDSRIQIVNMEFIVKRMDESSL